MQKNLLHRAPKAIMGWLHHHFLDRKLSTPFGIVLLGFVAMAMSYITVLVNYQLSIGIVGGVAALMLIVISVVYPMFGFYFSYFVSLFLMLPSRFTNSAAMLPTGLIPEYFSYLTLLGVLTKQHFRREADAKFWSSGIVLWSLLLLAYYMLELFNPAMGNKLGWFNFFRKQISFAIFIYVSYCFFDSKKAINFFMKSWIVLSSIEALYACKQQWFGFFNFEQQWLVADPKRYDLFVNYGFVRRFGLVSDPAAAGILYACGVVLLLVLALRSQSSKGRFVYYSLAIMHFLASSYTGTRTATLMVVAGIVFYCVLTLYEKKTLIFSAVFAFGLVGLLVAPIYNNMIINRLRSTFEGSKDPSALTRDLNRKIAQPYVYHHPIGGGINTSGMVGELYNPGHFLSFIPPDSAYMQTMMEQGPIGLALMVIFYYIILRTGIRHFYRVRDHDVQTLYVANLASIFSLFVAQFSQLAIGQYPSVLYFYSALALLLKLHKFDSSNTEATT